jgi:DNA-directed RNA polymerase subunit L
MSQSQDVTTPPSRVWLLSIPRSGSHLLTKIFSQQSKLSYSGYNFMAYIFQHHKIMDQNVTLDQLSTEDRDALLKTAKDGLAKTESAVDKIEAEVRREEEEENSPNLSTIRVCLLSNQENPRTTSPS